jgi:hypothetical protein
MSDVPARLKASGVDYTAAAFGSLTSVLDLAAPGTGSFFGMLLASVIPGQRVDRIGEYVGMLSCRSRVLSEMVLTHGDRIDALEQAMGELARSLTAEQIAVFEDGAFAAVGATNSDRIDRIANLVAHGIDDQDEVSRARQLVTLLAQISDDEVLVLSAYAPDYRRDREWMERHRLVLGSEPVVYASTSQPERDAIFERAALKRYRTDHLVSLGLLEEETRSTVEDLTRLASGGRIPDKLAVKTAKSSPRLTQLGYVLLKYVGLLRPPGSATLDPSP